MIDAMHDEAALTLRNDVIELISGCWKTQVAGAAAELRVPDLMGDKPTTAAAVATGTGTPIEPIRRLLRAMCSLDLARQLDDDRFELTERGNLLRDDVGGSLATLARIWAGRRWTFWSHLEQSLRTGDPIGEGFATASPDPAIGIAASRAQADRSRLPAAEVARTYDFSRVSRVLDVGGGHGTVLAAILKAHPALEGAVFDLPHHEPNTLTWLAAEGVADRGGFVGGSFFDGVPAGYDCVVLKSILHDWPDAECRALLKQCAAALGTGGTLLVIEELLPEIATADPAFQSAFRTDLTMLVSTGGLERTEREYAALLHDGGFAIQSVTANRSEFRLIEARVL
jgi:hypothetical protein